MNENHIEIKEQRKDWFFQGVLALILMIITLSIALLPLVSTFAKNHSVYFYIFGGLLFAACTAYFVLNLYKQCNPKIAIELNAHGFIDKKNVGNDIVVEWTNVAAVKLLGKTDMPFLGISLENNDIVLAQMKKGVADDMRENIDENLPAILIAQNEVRIPIKELKELFSKFAREARALENDVPKKPKNNPFSTDDVLRAFGQLDSTNNDATIDASAMAKKEDSVSTAKAESTKPKSAQVFEDVSLDDLIEQAAAEAESGSKKSQAVCEPSAEIDELLSKSKSSRIEEIGKLLTTDTPFTYQQGKADTIETKNVDTSLSKSPETIENTAQTEPVEQENVIEKNDNADEQQKSKKDSDGFDNLDQMIQMALDKSSQPVSKEIDSHNDNLAALINDLDKKVKKKRTEISAFENKESDK